MSNKPIIKNNGVSKKNGTSCGNIFALKPFRYLFEREVKELMKLQEHTLSNLTKLLENLKK